jgi:DNA polymerase III delta subunit
LNFNQWKGHAAKSAVAKVTYICGDQYTLVELVIDDIKMILDIPVTDFVSLSATDNFWESASQYSLDPTVNRLIVVRQADKISDWAALESWIKNRPANNYLVFVSEHSDAQSIYAKGKRVSYVEHIEIIRTKGKFIKCSLPNEDDLSSWAQSYGLSSHVAQHLIERTSRDTALMFNVLKKLHLWNGSPNQKVIDLLCEEQALDSFADYLIIGQKQTALTALSVMNDSDKSKVISKLDKRLDMLLVLGPHVRKRVYAQDIASNTGINIYLVKKFSPVVKNYDPKKIRYCRQILTLVDGALNNGVKKGAWEALVSLW